MSHAQRAIRSLLFRAFRPATIGRLEYVFRPSLRGSWGGPMNGQRGRQAIFRDILTQLQCKAIVETGTYLGTTTTFFAGFGLPVYTVETDPRYHGFAQMQLRRFRDRVHLSLGDSRVFLKRLAQEASFPKDSIFFYLDAHWESDLPLAEEITTIFATWQNSVIMIDDFAVPGDSYGYDDYGPGKSLEASYLDALGRTDMSRFYPAIRAYQESGSKRGCIVLCNDEHTRERLAALRSLRPA